MPPTDSTAQRHYLRMALRRYGSQASLGAALGVQQPQVSKWLRGVAMSPDRLMTLCRTMGWNPVEVFESCGQDFIDEDEDSEHLTKSELITIDELLKTQIKHKLEPDHGFWAGLLGFASTRLRLAYDGGMSVPRLHALVLMHYGHGLTITSPRSEVLRATDPVRRELGVIARKDASPWLAEATVWLELVSHRLARTATLTQLGSFMDYSGGALTQIDPLAHLVATYDAMLLAADLRDEHRFWSLARRLEEVISEVAQRPGRDSLDMQWAAVGLAGIARGAANLYEATRARSHPSVRALNRLEVLAHDMRDLSATLLPEGETIAKLRVGRLELTFLERGLGSPSQLAHYRTVRRQLHDLATRLKDERAAKELRELRLAVAS